MRIPGKTNDVGMRMAQTAGPVELWLSPAAQACWIASSVDLCAGKRRLLAYAASRSRQAAESLWAAATRFALAWPYLVLAVCAISPSLVLATAAAAQTKQTLVSEEMLTRVSDHVWALVAFPNIGIVVGDRATLVIDTGLGEPSGATVVRVEQRIARGPILYLTTTHYHTEHTTGEQAFPPNTVLVRPVVQQQEILQRLPAHIVRFRQMSEQFSALLTDVKLRTPDILFNDELKLDLGGVTARLFVLGPAHTQGDMLVFVDKDSVLFTGGIVENKRFPIMLGDESTMKGWIAVLDKLDPIKPQHIVPDHGELGDESLIPKEKAILVEIQGRALELKREGKSAEEAGKLLTDELSAKHPNYANVQWIAPAVKEVYRESQ